MVLAFINIRIKQIIRSTKEIGLFRSTFLIGLSGFIAFILFKQTAISPNYFYSIGIYLTTIIIFQLNRSDKQFLKIHFNNYKLILLTEYILLQLPLFICLFYYKHWIPIITVIALTLFIINIDFKPRQKSLNTFFQKLIPASCYEWKSGVRKSWLKWPAKCPPPHWTA